jgi:hypothetical protein
VKPLCADDSVAGCHVKVGHRQALNTKSPSHDGLFFDLNSITLKSIKLRFFSLKAL